LAIAAVYRLSIRWEGGNDGGFERELIFDGTRSRGCAFSVGSVGNYSIFFSSAAPPLRGQLEHDRLFSFVAADPYDTLYSAVPLYFATESVPASATALATPTSTATRPGTPREGRGIVTAVIVVPIVVLALAISVIVLLWWYRRHRQVGDEEYQSVNESFLDVHID
jgi:hypothetical protein